MRNVHLPEVFSPESIADSRTKSSQPELAVVQAMYVKEVLSTKAKDADVRNKQQVEGSNGKRSVNRFSTQTQLIKKATEAAQLKLQLQRVLKALAEEKKRIPPQSDRQKLKQRRTTMLYLK